MNILILSKEGLGLPVGWRLKSEGNNVRMYTKKPQLREVGKGFIEIVDDYIPSKKWADFIITDDSRMGKIADDLRKEGFVVWGGTEWTDKWEDDREIGQEVLKESGMTILPSEEFSDLESALAFVKTHPGMYVAKPEGKQVEDDKHLVYVGQEENGSDLIAVLENYKKISNKIEKILLQKRVNGIEAGISGFFNGEQFVEPIELTFEHKNLFPGPTQQGIGPKTGEMGTSQVWIDKSSKIYQKSIDLVVPYLKEEGYVGYLDINCIVTPDDLYPLEFTTRFGYPTIELWMETITGNLSELMFELASGVNRNFEVKAKYSVVIVLASPPFPYDVPEVYKKMSENNVVIFKNRENGKPPEVGEGIWPEEVALEDNKWIQRGLYGYPLVVSGSGDSIHTARNQAYSRISQIILPNSFYRTDIAETTPKNLHLLESWAWI